MNRFQDSRGGFYWSIMGIVFVLAACGGPKPLPRESVLDTPEAAYERGRRALETGNLAEAQQEFTRAGQLDPNYAPAEEGLGLVQLAQGHYTEAKRHLEKAKDKDQTYVPAWIGMGRVYDGQGKYDDALDEFRKALERDKAGHWHPFAHFYMGQTYEHQEDYTRAQEAYQSALQIDPNYYKANEAWRRLNQMQRTMTGMSVEYQTIAKSSAITRGELAALLVNELPLERIFRSAPEQREPLFQTPGSTGPPPVRPGTFSDTENSWAKGYIYRAVAVGVMEAYPDGTFKPDDRVTRVELAQVVQNVLVAALNDPALATAYIGNVSTLRDVPRTHFAFNAITLAINRGIMSPNPDGTFGLTNTVSGAEALRVIRALRREAE